jgi:hypothetical protein
MIIMKNITKNLMFAALGAILLSGSLGFGSTIEASSHNNIVHLDSKEQQLPELQGEQLPQDDRRGPMQYHGPEQSSQDNN